MSRIKKLFSYDISSVLIPLIVIFVILVVFGKGFLSSYNILSLLQTITIYVLIGLAQMAVLSLGQFNLAIGSIGSLSSIMMGVFFQEMGFPAVLGIIAGLIVATICGMLQGVLIAKTSINPFIITLALQSIFKGISNIVSKGKAFDIPSVLIEINNVKLGSVPLVFLLVLIVIAIIFIVFKYKKIGIRLQAVGANIRAAKFSGINVDKTVITGHAISGLICGIAAVIQVMRFGSAQLSVGDDWMMQSFVVAVLGGSLLSGGKVTVIGTFFGAILVVFINNALVLFGINTYAFQMIMGFVLIGAYALDKLRVTSNQKRATQAGGITVNNEKGRTNH